MKPRLKPAVVALLAVASISAHAELVEADWKTTGDARVTLDQSTGIEWLDITETKDLHYSEVVAQLDTTFAGWRLPTVDEVSGLMAAFFPTATYNDGGYTTASLEQRQRWVDLMGYTSGDLALGLHTKRNSPGQLGFSGVRVPQSEHSYIYLDRGTYNKSGTYSRDTMYHSGVFLVSDGGLTYSSKNDPSINQNNVNAPMNVFAPVGLSVFGWALFGVALRRQQKSRA